MYNYQGLPGAYGAPGYGGHGGHGSPMGMGPPGMGPPGVGGMPGMDQAQLRTPQPGGLPSNFQAPSNMDFSAPTLRMGFNQGQRGPGGPGGRRDGPEGMGGRRGMGLGYDRRDDGGEGRMRTDRQLEKPSREEIARTIYVGNITEGCGGDVGMERILACPGGLRRWIRARDASDKLCTFGFAEYEDADSLAIACEIFQNVRVPKKRPTAPKEEKKEEVKEEDVVKKEEDGDVKMEDEEDAQPPEIVIDDSNRDMIEVYREKGFKIIEDETTELRFVVDEQSKKYIEEWRNKGSLRDPADMQFKIDTAKEELQGILASLRRPATDGTNGLDGDIMMKTEDMGFDPMTGQPTLGAGAEDELAEVPAELRETVAKEIAAFRERSNRRDMERLQREEEMERQALRGIGGTSINRLASPPAGGANNIPIGPRASTVTGAPTGPRGYTGAQIPRDYQNGVNFTTANGHSADTFTPDEDDSASDSEIETRRRRNARKLHEKEYLQAERLWLDREKRVAASFERQKRRDDEQAENEERKAEDRIAKYRAYDDDIESARGVNKFYVDRREWYESRKVVRENEEYLDSLDRAEEAREQGIDVGRSRAAADDFLNKAADELAARSQTSAAAPKSKFTMSLGAAAAQRAQAAAAAAASVGPRKTRAMEVEGLLEDDEEASGTTRRALVPIKPGDLPPVGKIMSEEERADALRKLASEIPTNPEDLFRWPVAWDHLDENVIQEQLKPFVEKKVVEYLGVEEQSLVDIVLDGVRGKSKPEDLVAQLEEVFGEEDAAVLVRKVWRMVVFFAEQERRGLVA